MPAAGAACSCCFFRCLQLVLLAAVASLDACSWCCLQLQTSHVEEPLCVEDPSVHPEVPQRAQELSHHPNQGLDPVASLAMNPYLIPGPHDCVVLDLPHRREVQQAPHH